MPGPFPSKIQREGPRWGCTSSLESVLAGEAVSTRFILPGGWEPPLSGAHPIVKAPHPKVTEKAEEQPSEEAAPDSLSPPS